MCVSINGPGLATVTYDRLTLKLVCESRLKWGTFIPNLGKKGHASLWALELFATCATDGQTNATLAAPFLWAGA